MNNLPSRPTHAVVQAELNRPLSPAHASFRVEDHTGWDGIRDTLGIFRRHLWLIAVITTVSVGVAAWFASKEVKRYQSSATIRLIDRQPGTETLSEAPVGNSVDPVLSELVVLTGRTVLGNAVDREGLRLFSASTHTPAGFVTDVKVSVPPQEHASVTLEFGQDGVAYGSTDRRIAAYGEPIRFEGVSFVVPSPPQEKSTTLQVVPRDGAIDYVLSGLSANPNQSTGGVQITFTTTEPRISARTVNAIVEEYQEYNAEMERMNVVRRRAFLEEQLRTNDSLMMVAQSGLSSLRSSTQAYSAAERFTVEQGNLIQAEVQQAQLQADLRMHQNILNRIIQARSTGEAGDLDALMSLPGIASDPVVSQLYSQLITYQVEREGMVAGPWARAVTHPDVQRLNTLIASTQANLVQAVRNHIGSLEAQIAALGSIRGRAAAKMSELPRTEVQEVYLMQNLDALRQMGEQLRDQYQAVRLEEASEVGIVEVVQMATRSVPLPSNTWIKLLLGVIVGLMLGGGTAMVKEMLDDSINSPQEIEEFLLVPNLAVIPAATPYLTDGKSNGSRSVASSESPGQEAYRVLRTNLLFSQEKLKSLVVTSAAPGEGKTMTAVNLAAAYARQGMKVILMECDLRRPSLGKYFEQSNDVDLTSVLFENRDWRQATQASKIPGLHVLLAGRAFSRAAEFLGGDEMRDLLKNLSLEYDMVILDTSPLLVAADATVLGAMADGVLLVVRASQTDRGAVQQAVHQLELVGARVVGTVLNDPDGAVAQYGHYYDYSAEYEVG